MVCAYAIFCESISINSPKHISAKDIFSSLTLSEPGTTEMVFVIGLSSIKKDKSESLEVRIKLPNEKNYSAKWTSPVSDDEYSVYNAVFNCNKIPFENSGICTFTVISGETKKELGRRYLRVKVGRPKEEDANE